MNHCRNVPEKNYWEFTISFKIGVLHAWSKNFILYKFVTKETKSKLMRPIYSFDLGVSIVFYIVFCWYDMSQQFKLLFGTNKLPFICFDRHSIWSGWFNPYFSIISFEFEFCYLLLFKTLGGISINWSFISLPLKLS